jgi:hypothetical protein
MNPSNNGTVRMTPEQAFSRAHNELCQRFMLEGGSVEYVLGTMKIAEIFYTGPHWENSLRQAAAMAAARNQIPKEAGNDEISRNPAG